MDLALARLRDLAARQPDLRAFVHSDRVDLQRMADHEAGILMRLTPDRDHPFMRLAHHTSRSARREAARACQTRGFVDAAD